MNITVRKSKKRLSAIDHGYRSNLEMKFADILKSCNVDFEYEKKSLLYKQPVTHKNVECSNCGCTDILQHRKYSVDFYIPISEKYLEVKGLFPMKDRKKMLAVIAANPTLDIIMVFSKPKLKISKTSKLNYMDWCDQNNISWTSVRKLQVDTCNSLR